ncbi:invertase/recombinase like protein [Marinobacter sp. ELB17]|nr:invertase/recombinase like protein [Marinobacter sp. ELB17]
MVEIVQELSDKEVGFKLLTETIDATSSGGRLAFHIFGALAEFEHNLIRERTIAGLQTARARGVKVVENHPCRTRTSGKRQLCCRTQILLREKWPSILRLAEQH